MSKKEKRFLDLKNAKSDVSFLLLKRVLEDFQYELIRTRGSHFHFRKTGAESITIPAHNNRVKKVYIKDILKLLIKN